MVGQAWITVNFTMAGQQELVGRFAAWGSAVDTQMQPAWEQVGERLQEDFAQQFADEGGYLGAQVGPAWAQLRPATVLDRIRKGYPGNHPILVREGNMMLSLTHRGAPNNVFEATDHGVKVGTVDPIAPYHQHGTRKMVARVMVGLRWETRSDIIRILGDYVRMLARQAGLHGTGGGGSTAP